MWVILWVVLCHNCVIDLVTMTLQLPFFLDANSADRRSRLSRKGIEWESGEKPANLMRRTEEENWGTMRAFQPRGEADEFQKIMSLVKNLSI